jgi:hypothetical protein
MTQELRALERSGSLSREDWITKFVNAIVRELRPGLDRMVAVAAAREAWPAMQSTAPYLAAKEWAGGHAAE